MKILVNKAGKRFNREWIFKNRDLEFHAPNHYAITGHNGSGKSTLVQCIAGALHLSEGSIEFEMDGKKVEPEDVFKYISICAPYLEVIEDMTVVEFLHYHASFKPFQEGWTAEKIIEEIGLTKASNKRIRNYSSGMKQRVKLAQAFFSKTPVLLLDEPCTNLDKQGIDLYRHLINTVCNHRLVLICSNDTIEYESCSAIVSMSV
jgi:ABC-type multidrug transport system ATPase subunit